MASDPRRQHARGRRGERGATLTVIALASGMMLLAFGSVYMSSAEGAYRLTALRAREAALYGAADAGLAEALERLKKDQATPLSFAYEVESGVHIDVTSTPGSPTTVSIRAKDSRKGAHLGRTLVARVDFPVTGGVRLVGVSRQ